MASILLLITALGAALVHAVARAVVERRALEREEAALEVLARVRRHPVDMGDERLHHDQAPHQSAHHHEDGVDSFHVRVLGTTGPHDPRATPRPVPVSAVPVSAVPAKAMPRWAASPPSARPAAPPVPVATAEPARSAVAVKESVTVPDAGLSGVDHAMAPPPPMLRLGSFDDGGEAPPVPVPRAPLPPLDAGPLWTGHSARTPRRSPAVLAAAACLVAVAVAASVGSDSSEGSGGSLRPEAPTGAAVADRATGAASPTTTTTITATTTTTPPPKPAAPVLVRGDEAGAEYRLTGGFGVSVRAADVLYVRVDGADGATLFEAMMQPGQEQTFLSSGPVRVRVGNTTLAHIVVNGGPPMLLPATGSPYNLDLITGEI